MPLITAIRKLRSGRATTGPNDLRSAEWRVLVLDDGRRLRVDVEQVARRGLEPGAPLDAGAVARLEARDAYCRARERALRLLAARPRSAQEIRERLRRDRVPPPTIGAVIDDLVEDRVVDDLTFARSWIARRMDTRSFGARRLRWELRQKGVPAPAIDRALREVIGDHGDIARIEEQSALALVRGARRRYDHLSADREARRIAALLQRRGFAAETIARVLRTIGRTDGSEDLDG